MLRGLLLLAALVAAGAAVASALPAKRLRDGSGTIKLSTSLIQGGGGPVVVSWDGFEFATADDWIGMWCPVPEDWTHTNPTKFIRVKTSAPETWHAGRGSAQFYAVNVRGDCIFQYMTGDEEYPEVLGVSKPLVFANHNYPMGLHIALTNQTGEMRVSWTSASNTRPTVCLSTQSSGDCQQTFGAESSTYTREDMCGSVASGSGFIDPGYLHTSVLTGLKAGTRYYYSVGDSTDSKSWSPKASFLAPNPPGTDDVTKIIAFGDMGQADPLGALQHSFDNNDAGELSSLNTSGFLQQEFATSNPPSLLLHIGDISYAVGFGAEWDQFFHQIEPVAKAFPWMTSIGNHEIGDPKSFIAGTDSQGECGVPYSARFRMPFPADTGRPDKAWYSFQHGLLHIIQMSTEHDFRNGTEQHAWIEEALRSVDRSVTPWVVFTGHRPMYVNDDFDEPVGVMLRDNVEPLLVQYKVDVALWGHNHSYQRMCQLIRGSCVPGAPKHFTIGMAGYSLTGGTGDQPYMEYFNNTVWGFSRITATRTTFMLEFVPNGSSEAMDSFTLHH